MGSQPSPGSSVGHIIYILSIYKIDEAQPGGHDPCVVSLQEFSRLPGNPLVEQYWNTSNT